MSIAYLENAGADFVTKYLTVEMNAPPVDNSDVWNDLYSINVEWNNAPEGTVVLIGGNQGDGEATVVLGVSGTIVSSGSIPFDSDLGEAEVPPGTYVIETQLVMRRSGGGAGERNSYLFHSIDGFTGSAACAAKDESNNDAFPLSCKGIYTFTSTSTVAFGIAQMHPSGDGLSDISIGNWSLTIFELQV